MKNRFTISQVAERVGITSKTIIRWEKSGKIESPKRDWRGWRVYTEKEVSELEKIINRLY